MIGIGSATRFGINRAKGENTDHYFLQSVFWSVLCSVPFIITGIVAPEKFLHLLGADAGLTALGKKLSPHHADHYAAVYGQLYVYCFCKK